MKPRHFQKARGLRQELRSELGDEGYDELLFASGQPNRAVVRDVIGRSAAQRAGLAPGDVIRRYDGELVFAPGDIQRATATGTPGTLVAIDFERDGRDERIYIPRGPIGVVLQPRRLEPAATP